MLENSMTEHEADQIATLLNTRNQLSVAHTGETVLRHAERYLFETETDAVVACVEVKRVQWYQWEICHLSVHADHEGRGLGKELVRRAEEAALRGGACIAQCTIRVGNRASEHVFQRSGYTQTVRFHNPSSGNDVGVWQKALSERPTDTR